MSCDFLMFGRDLEVLPRLSGLYQVSASSHGQLGLSYVLLFGGLPVGKFCVEKSFPDAVQQISRLITFNF